jgi:RNA polymerase sigma-70 factor (ECF subfamily)
METNDLLQWVSEDKRGAFDLFYNQYYDRVFRFAFYFLQNKEACRDVVADVFFSVWQSRRKLKEVSNIETYLYTAVRNESNRYLKNKNRLDYLALEDIPLHLKAVEEESPEEILITAELEQRLMQAINNLPSKCRTIFLMARIEGLPPKEIAAILAIQESTVRVQMKIAMEKIATAIQG